MRFQQIMLNDRMLLLWNKDQMTLVMRIEESLSGCHSTNDPVYKL